MSRWVLDCPDCNKTFTHSQISLIGDMNPPDPFLLWAGPKPEFPAGGVALVCPNCKKSFTYQRHELVLQSS